MFDPQLCARLFAKGGVLSMEGETMALVFKYIGWFRGAFREQSVGEERKL